jgi:hypothetical protein
MVFRLAEDDLDLTFEILFEFRSDITNILGPQAKEVFQDGPIKSRLCSMSCDATSTPFSDRLQPVFISYHTISEAANGNRPPRPPLNTIHMNKFIDRQIMDLLGDELYGLMVSKHLNLWALRWTDID